MEISQICLDLIKKWEGFRANAYLDPVGIPTIGYGTIRYPDGSKVKMGEKITMKKADELIQWHVNKIASKIPALNVNQNQYDALVSFVYNVGIGAFLRSTLYRKCKANPDDPTIKDEFMKWKRAGGKVSQGLINRRTDEYNLYAKI